MKHVFSSPLLVAILFLAFTGTGVQAQDMPATPNDLAGAKAGECYAQVVTPPTYDTVTRRVQIKEASTRLEMIPAVYETATERVQIKEASTRISVVPAVYETATERVMVKEASTRLEMVPAVYETATEQILVQPARKVWKTSSGRIYGAAITDVSGKPVTKMNKAGEVLCLVEEPAEYKTVTKRMLKTPATTRTVEVPAEYKTVTKRVLKTPATTRTIEVPAEYKTVTKRVLKTPATTRTVEVPAEFDTVTERKMVSEGASAWVRVLCEMNVTQAKLKDLQRALMQSGHYGGSIDGVYGTQTATAITAYQQTKGLAQGYGLTLQTLDALNVRY